MQKKLNFFYEWASSEWWKIPLECFFIIIITVHAVSATVCVSVTDGIHVLWSVHSSAYAVCV